MFAPILKRYQIPEADREYVLQFFISGLMAVINAWLKNDCQDSVEHIISVMQLCIKRT